MSPSNNYSLILLTPSLANCDDSINQMQQLPLQEQVLWHLSFFLQPHAFPQIPFLHLHPLLLLIGLAALILVYAASIMKFLDKALGQIVPTKPFGEQLLVLRGVDNPHPFLQKFCIYPQAPNNFALVY